MLPLIFTLALAPSTPITPADGTPAPITTLKAPPDGTYTYEFNRGGQSIGRSVVVVTSGADGGVRVRESQTFLGAPSASADLRLSSQLEPASYSATYLAGGRSLSATVTFGSSAASETAGGATKSFPLLSGTTRFTVFDGTLISGVAVLAAQMAQYHNTGTTALAPVYGQSVQIAVRADDRPKKPVDVPSSSRDISFSGAVPFVVWYDPTTWIVHEIVVTSQSITVKLTSQTAATAAPTVTGPAPVRLGPRHYTDRKVTFRSADGVKLAGTLSVPTGPTRSLPAIVLVPGSGAVNRDEQIGPNKLFAQIGHAVANAGFVVLRYDKRGIGQSGGDANKGVRTKLMSDLGTAIRFLRRQPSVDKARVFALGHSEGGQLVPLVAAAGAPLAGVALMAPPALPLDQVIAKQGPPSNPTIKMIVRSEWFKSYLGVDPAATITRVHQPILILQGEEDENVLATDAPRLVNAAKTTNHDVTYKLYAHDAHEFLMLKPGQTMFDTATVIDPAMIDDLVAWLRAHSR